MHPIDVPTLETLAFVERYLPFPGARLLEVGCGRGALAAALTAKGMRVRGIDSSPEVVAEARARGVDAVEADILSYEDAPFDVVLFSRSLHHIHPLHQAVNKAHGLLNVGGLLLVEDFGADRADRRGTAWRYEVESLLHVAGLIGNGESEYDSSADPLARWREEHFGEHSIATSVELIAAARQKFPQAAEETAPYLYRYLVDRLEPSERGFPVAQHLLAWEKRLIAAGDISPIGLWLVARRV
ncbi:MAG TPA: class I SAM-dependent methyltransferase [Blastocatellia bacterium]|nr:class I SAM-dependent methyltransferase [Blastocatellia bacterium]